MLPIYLPSLLPFTVVGVRAACYVFEEEGVHDGDLPISHVHAAALISGVVVVEQGTIDGHSGVLALRDKGNMDHDELRKKIPKRRGDGENARYVTGKLYDGQCVGARSPLADTFTLVAALLRIYGH